MTDFKGFNPDRNLGANFNTRRQNQGAQPDANQPQGETAPASDPYAELKMDPDRMMSLLSAQGQLNMPNMIENGSVERSIEQFTQMVTPERHAQTSRLISDAFVNEFGNTPQPELLQNMVDNYLIGQVSIQNP